MTHWRYLKVWSRSQFKCASLLLHTGKWGLRDYGVSGQLGLEKTPEDYVEKMVEVFREVKRTLRKDGTLWLNLGDGYAGSGRGWGQNPKQMSNRGSLSITQHHASGGNSKPPGYDAPGYKPKDLIGIPWRVAFALQADGWWLRSDIIWHKPNPMPESVTDRPTKSHEYIFLLTKSARYFFDQEAVREEATGFDGRKDTIYKGGPKDMNCGPHERWKKRKNDGTGHGGDGAGFQNHSGYDSLKNPYARNIRTVWTIATQPQPEAHFATFPEALVERCILAGTSEKGCCPDCGKPWVRVTEHIKGLHNHRASIDQRERTNTMAGGTESTTIGSGLQGQNITLGWQPTCDHGREPVPCVVLDPFAGTNTTGRVAKKLGRDYISIELNPKYIEIAERVYEKGVGLLF